MPVEVLDLDRAERRVDPHVADLARGQRRGQHRHDRVVGEPDHRGRRVLGLQVAVQAERRGRRPRPTRPAGTRAGRAGGCPARAAARRPPSPTSRATDRVVVLLLAVPERVADADERAAERAVASSPCTWPTAVPVRCWNTTAYSRPASRATSSTSSRSSGTGPAASRRRRGAARRAVIAWSLCRPGGVHRCTTSTVSVASSSSRLSYRPGTPNSSANASRTAGFGSATATTAASGSAARTPACAWAIAPVPTRATFSGPELRHVRSLACHTRPGNGKRLPTDPSMRRPLAVPEPARGGRDADHTRAVHDLLEPTRSAVRATSRAATPTSSGTHDLTLSPRPLSARPPTSRDRPRGVRPTGPTSRGPPAPAGTGRAGAGRTRPPTAGAGAGRRRSSPAGGSAGARTSAAR